MTVPYVCPFCAEEDLRPVEHGWHCRSCLRVFSVSFHGLAQPDPSHRPDARLTPRSEESDRR